MSTTETLNPLTNQLIDDATLHRVAELARKQYRLETLVTSLTEQLAEAEKNLTQVRETELPDAMLANGLESFTLSNGYRVKISSYYSASIPPAEGKNADSVRRACCFGWLRNNGFGALIRTEIRVTATAGDEPLVKKVTELLQKESIPYSQGDAVHHMTLKAFVRERCESGAPPPIELFNTFQGKRAKLERA